MKSSRPNQQKAGWRLILSGVIFLFGADLSAQTDDLLLKKIEQLDQRIAELEAKQDRPPFKRIPTNMTFRVWGQFSRQVLAVDNGAQSDVMSADTGQTSSRIGALAEARIHDEWMIGGCANLSLRHNMSYRMNFNSYPGFSIDPLQVEMYVESQRYGRLAMGQGQTASDGSSEMDLSGGWMAGKGAMAYLLNAMEFEDGTTTVGSVINVMDGLGKQDRIRYDTPYFSGVKVACSLVNGGARDVVLRYNGRWKQSRVKTALAFADHADYEQLNGSASILFQEGASVTVSAGQRYHVAGLSPCFGSLMLGQKFQPWAVGKTCLTVDYGVFSEISLADTKAHHWGIGLVQKLDDYSVELFTGYRETHVEQSGPNLAPMRVGFAGVRIKF